ncbi:MAG: hypothetical protein L6R39_003631 [Caloplaca ligustica]|nr:MAG: hypothetical protein L6R39_003631 [Caloplaca ligustica]
MAPTSRGAFIVIEGLDRAGKSTQCEMLSLALEQQGHPVKRMRFPNRSTSIGQSIDSYLKGDTQQEDHAIHLLFSANRWEAASQICKDIANGITIIVDRYYYSGAVYSAAKNRPDLSLEWAMQPDIGLPKPDLCIFLDISLEEAAARGEFGKERYETNEMQERVRALFGELLKRPKNEEMVVVDAGRSLDEVKKRMLQLANEALRFERIDRPLRIFGRG